MKKTFSEFSEIRESDKSLKITDSNLFTVMTNVFVTEFSETFCQRRRKQPVRKGIRKGCWSASQIC